MKECMVKHSRLVDACGVKARVYSWAGTCLKKCLHTFFGCEKMVASENVFHTFVIVTWLALCVFLCRFLIGSSRRHINDKLSLVNHISTIV